jgi:hypothetical protein
LQQPLVFLILFIVSWLFGAVVQSAELNTGCQPSPEPKPLLGLLEYAGSSELEGTPIRFALYSNRTVIYRDRKNRHAGFITGTVDDEAWQTFEKIVAGLPEVKTNFAFREDEGQSNSLILFNDGKLMRQLSMCGPVSARKTGNGKLASYSTSVPAIQCQSPLFGSGEVPQSAIGAWYETHCFVPKDAHPWIPDHFDVSLFEGTASKTVSWLTIWPQLSAAKQPDYSSGLSLQMPGKYLNEFERLFQKIGTATRFSGHTLVVSYSISLPSEHELFAAVPVGEEQSLRKLPSLPSDFLQKTKLGDIKKIARERSYDITRIVSEGPVSNGVGLVRSADVIEELCQSNDSEEIDAGLELTLEAKRKPLRTASVIASAHAPELTQALIVRHIADGKFLEIITPLIQESVARGADYDAVEPISTFWGKLKKQNDPLAWLPLHRMDIERSISFPSYSAGGSVSHLPSTSVQGTLEKQPSRTTPEKPFTGVPLPINEEAAARCVRSWKTHSNGKFEAKLFEVSSAISAGDVSTKQLLKLQLECLAGATPREVKLDAVPSDRVFEILFGAASNGGAYGGSEAGAYGRLAAWQSLAALTGVGVSGTFDDAYSAAKQSSWCSISSTSKWFHNVAWDFAVVCLRQDKQHIAVLAASDED